MSEVQADKRWLKHYDPNVPPTLNYETKTYVEKFREVVAAYPDKAAIVYMGKRITFRELDDLSDRVARYLVQCGLKPDDVVGLHLPNIPAHYIGIVGIQKAGCVSTGLSPLLTPGELVNQIRDSGTKMIFTIDLLFGKIAEIADRIDTGTIVVSEIADFLPGVKRVLGKLLKKIPTAEVAPLAGKKTVKFMDVVRETPPGPVDVQRGIDDTIFIMYTGGTTGPAKGAVLTHRSYMCNRQQVLAWTDILAEDTILSAFPLFHIAGLALGGFSMTHGTTQICVPNPRDTHFIIEAIKAHQPHYIVNVPTVFYELMKNPEFKRLDMPNLKWCLSAAAPFPTESIGELEGIIGKGNFIELYGMTETSPVTSCNPRYGVKKAGSIGMPVPDTEFVLIDPGTGQPVKQGDPGEIVIRGPQLMKEYFGKPEETANTVRNGWLFTGDIAIMDEDGYFSIVDRLKDMVIVSGFKVFTRELDEVLSKHPDIAQAASVGIPDPERPGSERVASAIVLKADVDKSEAQKTAIIQYLKEQVASYKIPKRIEFMDELPTSGVGKVLKREIKAMMMESKKD
ncbi:MAG: AMP-binding protein [Syntrophaceae bacterium]|nr:AMP-binding protein [Syntrophaceae bacterium]